MQLAHVGVVNHTLVHNWNKVECTGIYSDSKTVLNQAKKWPDDSRKLQRENLLFTFCRVCCERKLLFLAVHHIYTSLVVCETNVDERSQSSRSWLFYVLVSVLNCSALTIRNTTFLMHCGEHNKIVKSKSFPRLIYCLIDMTRCYLFIPAYCTCIDMNVINPLKLKLAGLTLWRPTPAHCCLWL